MMVQLVSQTKRLFRTWCAILIGCLLPIRSCALQDVDDPEEAAERAGEELLAEEERLKAQAAAKKAKKQRQKAKKQQAQAALQTGPALAPEPASSEALHHDRMPDAPVPVPGTQTNQLTGSEPLCSGQQAPSDGHIPPSSGHEQANGQQAPSDGHFPPSSRHEQANGQQAPSDGRFPHSGGPEQANGQQTTCGGHQQDADTPAASSLSAESAAERHSQNDQQQASQSDQASTDPGSSKQDLGLAPAGILTRLAPPRTACPDDMADSWQVAPEPEAIQVKQRRERCDQKADHQFLQALFCCPLTHVSLTSQARHHCLPRACFKLLQIVTECHHLFCSCLSVTLPVTSSHPYACLHIHASVLQ